MDIVCTKCGRTLQEALDPESIHPGDFSALADNLQEEHEENGDCK